MRFRPKKVEASQDLSQWHEFFAMLPVYVENGDLVVFETVLRKGEWVPSHWGHSGYWNWKYKDLE